MPEATVTAAGDPTAVRPLPLDGILVADFSRVLAGPLATMMLADLGARVIKVERPGVGDDTRAWGPPWSPSGSTYFESVNRGKKSVALDLSDADDLSLARELTRRADVLIHNFKPGTMTKLGLGYDEVRMDNPGIVYCAINGFGSRAGRDLLGYDFVVQAVGGLMSITGERDEPMKAGVALVDVLTGKDAAIGILAALHAREHTGHGDHLEVTLLTSLLGSLVNQSQGALETGRSPGGMGNQHPSIAPYETLHTADGLIAVACGNDGQFTRLATAIERPQLSADPRFTTNALRVEHRPVLIAELEDALASADASTWVGRLNRAQVPAGRVNTIHEAVRLADDLELDPLVEVGPDRTAQIRHPISWTTYGPAQPSAPPVLGEHTASVRAWLSEPPG